MARPLQACDRVWLSEIVGVGFVADDAHTRHLRMLGDGQHPIYQLVARAAIRTNAQIGDRGDIGAR